LFLAVAAVTCAAGVHVTAIIIGLARRFAGFGTRIAFKRCVVTVNAFVVIEVHDEIVFWLSVKFISRRAGNFSSFSKIFTKWTFLKKVGNYHFFDRKRCIFNLS
jgi:hypothetical protein